MATPKPPLSPQMQDALQRGDIRALLHAARAAEVTSLWRLGRADENISHGPE